MTDQKKRQIAHQIWISDLLVNQYIKQPGEWDSNYIDLNGKQVSRVNILGTVVSKFKAEDNSYSTISIDDGSAGIRIKAWREDVGIFEEINNGNIVNVIGKIKEFNDERYILPEIIKTLDNPNWELLRKLSLIKKSKPIIFKANQMIIKPDEAIQGSEEETQKDYNLEEEFIEETPREKILNLIEKYGPEGVEIDKIIIESKMEDGKVDAIIEDLLKEGEVFSISGKLKIVK